jgi:hypothetical protein
MENEFRDGQGSPVDLGPSVNEVGNQERKPVEISRSELRLLQGLRPTDSKWVSSPLIEAQGLRVNSGIVLVCIEGKVRRMSTAAHEFGRLLSDE